MRSDLQAAHDALARYFDPSSKSVQTVSALVDQVSQAEPGVPLPDLSTSLQALRQYKSRS
jgi:uroporphyrinogen III methyltransferase/synthase